MNKENNSNLAIKNTAIGRWYRWMPALALAIAFIIFKFPRIPSANDGIENHENEIKSLELKLSSKPLNFHLIWTTSPSTFKERNMDVLEAYFYHHPNAQITILASELKPEMFHRFTSSGYNISIVEITDQYLLDLSDGCPGHEWIRELSKWKTGRYYYSHITDYIRFCTLYKNGGIYSDFDAILLNRLDIFENFIGKDSSGSDGDCQWCISGGDTYLAPGIMGTSAGHSLPKLALKIGFEGNYDPNIFNQVGPMAVTKAFSLNPSNIKILEKSMLYPYNYLTSWKVFNQTENAKAKMIKLQRSSISLHLYGHKTSKLEMHPESILRYATDFFRVTKIHDPNPGIKFQLRHPTHLAISNGVTMLDSIRILTLISSENVKNIKMILNVKCEYGEVKVANQNNSFSKDLTLIAHSSAEMNFKMSKLMYLTRDPTKSRETIKLGLMIKNENDDDIQLAQYATISLYNTLRLLTIIVKTFDRMDKVFSLVSSCSKMYPGINIIVADDAKNITKSEGQRKHFYYMPLPYDVGLSAGRNRMIEKVKTEYFLTLDDDFTCSTNSRVEDLIHALETPQIKTGRFFDIAGGKNPNDEAKYDLDFCGIIKVQNQTMFLEPGNYGSHAGCQHVDFVPNLFIAKTSLLKSVLQWDEDLKLGEHEDFFYRAKSLGVGVLTCPTVEFLHHQVDNSVQKKTQYDSMRSRVYDFFKKSLRKHNLLKLVSFGKTMMDLVRPTSVREFSATSIFARTIKLYWKSDAQSFHILASKDNGLSFQNVNVDEGNGYEKGNSIVAKNLKPNTEYTFHILAGNRFEYEHNGVLLKTKTISRTEEKEINLIENPSFENGHFSFNSSIGAIYHIIDSTTTIDGQYVGRTQISTRSYLSDSATKCRIYQDVSGDKIYQRVEETETLDTITMMAFSKLEALHHTPTTKWDMQMIIYFENGESRKELYEFDTSSKEWQTGIVTVCIGSQAKVSKVRVVCNFEGIRGAAIWDLISLFVNKSKES